MAEIVADGEHDQAANLFRAAERLLSGAFDRYRHLLSFTLPILFHLADDMNTLPSVLRRARVDEVDARAFLEACALTLPAGALRRQALGDAHEDLPEPSTQGEPEGRGEPTGTWSVPAEALDILQRSGHAHEFYRSQRAARLTRDSVPDIGNNVLVAAFGTFEASIQEVIKGFFHARPQAINAREVEFTLEQLLRFSSVEDARQEAVAARVERTMFGGFDTWEKFFRDSLKLELKDLALDWDATIEAVERRHVLVHHGGRISRRYQQRIERTSNVGDPLPTGTRRTSIALDNLFVLGLSLVWETWRKVDSATFKDADLVQQSYELLVDQRYAAARHVGELAYRIAPDALQREMAYCNALIGRRRSNDDSVDQAIATWDVSALAMKFAIAKLALARQFAEVSKLLPVALERKELEASNVLSWPLFHEYRKSDAYLTVKHLIRPTTASFDEVPSEDADPD